MTKSKTTAERLTKLETKLDLLMNNHMAHFESRMSRLEAGMIGLLCFAITNLIVVVWNLI
tara:strand:- start:556 stop:735 length:180 start_codon:yes stop_codon:yes gene_type:complete